MKNILNHVHNPTPKSALFPYSYYDSAKELFYAGNVAGFILRCDPIVGCSADHYKQISLLFEDYLPFGGCLQVLLLASDDLTEPLSKWISARVRGTRVCDDEIYKRLESNRISFFNEHNQNKENNFKIRNYELFFSFSMPFSKKLNAILEFREKLAPCLSSLGLNPCGVDGTGLLALVRALANYPNSSDAEYNELDLISNQISDTSTNLLVNDDGILHSNGEFVTKCYEVAGFPEHFSIGQIPHLLGDSEHNNMQIPACFALSYVVFNNLTDTKQESLKIKGEGVIAQSRTMLARFSNTLAEESKEWQEILSENLKKRKEKFLTAGLSVLVTAERSQITKVGQKLEGLWKKNDFYIKEARYFHFPIFLSAFPFLPSIETGKILKQFNVTRTVLSSEAKALLPIHAEWKGSSNGGMLLIGRKGQLFSWDSFEGSNYNACIIGESGSGKSVFLQEYVMSQLAKGARVFVIDIGRSFEKTCKIMNGDFVSFGSNSKISLNPFSNIPLDSEMTQDCLSTLKFVIAKMIAPKAGTKDIQDAMIATSLFNVWNEYKNNANIDRLAEVLKREGDRGADLALMLFEFTSRGNYGKFFAGDANISFKKDFTVLEFEELRERPDLGAVIMQMVAIQIVQQVYLSDRKQRFVILFDEAWYALKNFPQMLASMARTVRKYNGALILGTQSLTDFYGDNDAATEDDKARAGVIENSAWRVLLKQKSDSCDTAKRIGLGKGQIELLKNLQAPCREYSENLICQSDKEYFVSRLMLDKFSQILYSSKPEVFSAVSTLVKQGFSTVDAITKVMHA